ncbi:MAG: PAS domain-containing protein [Polaromonas sp.]|uniref:PAS domain-containing protein n=1 Tax=Polaromonas sp. TaxID=1869339 RepID=UPI0027369ABE|nr:PAS domain-containing protein [Polaromonas sp.]MDP2817632.1 PAS domain-containing protein [Polaromonas sp.]
MARRGFVLTGDATFNSSLDVASRQVKLHFRELEDAIAQSPSPETDLAAKVAKLISMVDIYEDHIRRSLTLRIEQPKAEAEQQKITQEGEALSRAIHQALTDIEKTLDRQFAVDIRFLASVNQGLQKSGLWVAFVGLAMLLGAYAAVIQEARRRYNAESALVAANTELEMKVQARTAALAAGEARFRRLVELSVDAIVLCGADRTVAYANPAAHRLLKSGGQFELEGRAVESLFAQGEASWVDFLWESPQQLGFTDANVLNASDEKIPVQLGAISYFDVDGLRAQLVLHDMTVLKATETAIKEQLRFIDQLLEAIPMPLSVRDERGHFLRINRAYEIAYGCTRNETRQRSVFDILPYELAGRIAQQDQAAMSSLTSQVFDNQVAFPGAPHRDFLTRAGAMRRTDGSVIGVIAVDTDVTDLRLKEAELRQGNAELEALSKKLIQSQEDERRRIARDLHDQVGQILTALKMSLEMLGARDAAVHLLLQRPVALADEALSHTRSLTASLHPHILEDLGLDAAVRWLVDKFARPFMAAVRIEVRLEPPRGQPANELVAFRVVQEAITNVMRHANASRLRLSLKTRGKLLHILVADDGDGFDASVTLSGQVQTASLGLASMRERLAEVGGGYVD